MSRKALRYITVGAIGLIVVIFVWRYLVTRSYNAQIPELSNLHTLSQPVQEQISEALEKVRRRPSAENLGMMGIVYHSCAQYEEAGQCYELAIGRKGADWIWYYYKGYLHMEMGESESAIESFQTVIENNPDATLALYYLGEGYRNRRNHAMAEETFGKILTSQNDAIGTNESARQDHFPLSAYARYQLSRIYLETERMDLAEQTLREILQANRTFGPAYRLLGNIFTARGDSLSSERYRARANDLLVYAPPVDTLVDRLVLMSRSELLLLKKIDEAERRIYDDWTLKLVQQALTHLPENPYVLSKAIAIFLWMGMSEEAIDLMERHLDAFQEDANELTKTGLLFIVNGLYPQTITYLTRAVDLKPEEVGIQKELALCYASAGEKEEALQVLNGLIENNRNDPEVLAEVADILFFNLRETESASSMVSGLNRRIPTHPKVLKVYAGIAEQDGDLQRAVALYESSIRQNPEEINTIKHLGNLLFGQKMWERSIMLYKEALEFHPNDPYFLEKLGSLLALCPDPAFQDVSTSLEYLERAFIHTSSQPQTLLSAGRSLAVACAKLGDKRNAIRTIEQTIEIGRYENITPTSMAELENLQRAFQGMNN